MEHPVKLLWLNEGVEFEPQPSPKGRRVVGVVFRGTLIGLAAVSEDDYLVVFRAAGLFTDATEGGSASAERKTTGKGLGSRLPRQPHGGTGAAAPRDTRATRGTPVALTRLANRVTRAVDAHHERGMADNSVGGAEPNRVDKVQPHHS